MPCTAMVPGIRLFLRWVGVVCAVVAVVAGILGMHVMGQAVGTSTTLPTMSAGAALSPGPNAQSAAAGNSADPAAASAIAVAVPAPDLPLKTQAATVCACSPGCGASMAMDGVCTPTFAPTGLTVPAPDSTSKVISVTTVAVPMGQKAYGHIPESPSLAQLSISRT